MQTERPARAIIACLIAAIFSAAPALAVTNATELAQNPVGNLISVPVQNTPISISDRRRVHRTCSTYRQAAGEYAVVGYYNVVTPDYGADWKIRARVQLMFPG